MNYIDRLTQSIEELEANSKQLSEISDLLKSIKGLTNEIRDEKKEILICKDQNDKIYDEISTEVSNLKDISQKNELVFQNITNTIKEGIIKSKSENIEAIESFSTSISSKLTIFESNIVSEIINKLSLTENALLSNIKDELEKNKIENLESIKSDIKDIEDKFATIETNIISSISTIEEELSSDIKKQAAEIEKQNNSIKSIRIIQSVTLGSLLFLLLINIVNFFI